MTVRQESRSTRRQRNAPTISDVATRAGVSPMTVSRVINSEGNVRAETRKRVEAAIAALNYAPSAAARMLAGGDEYRLGVLHTNTSLFYFSEFLVGCLDQASRSNCQIVIERCTEGTETAAIEHLLHDRIDGVLLPPPLGDSTVALEVLRRHDVPVVAVSTGRAPEWALSVSIDDRKAAHEMTRHLGTLGHRRIGFITGAANQTASSERLDGYRAALADMGLPDDPALIAEGTFSYRSGLDAGEQLLDLPDAPTAIFASNDDMAAAVVSVAHRRHLDVPADLTVTGFDDSTAAVTLWPPLTTIRQPVHQLAAEALQLLLQEMRTGRTIAPRRILPHVLVERESTATPCDRDQMTATAD